MAIDIVKLYKEAKEESMKRPMPGTASGKAERVRKLVKEIARKTGEKKLLLSAVYQAVRAALAQQNIKVERTYFQQVVKRSFKVVKENGRLYIVVEK